MNSTERYEITRDTGMKLARYPKGECVLPNECMCVCYGRYNPNKCHEMGGSKEGSGKGTDPFRFEGGAVCLRKFIVARWLIILFAEHLPLSRLNTMTFLELDARSVRGRVAGRPGVVAERAGSV
jgi:hypothetical protein